MNNQKHKQGKGAVCLLLGMVVLLLILGGFPANGKGVSAQGFIQPELFRTAPGDLPRFTVSKGSAGPGEGYIFMSPFDYTAARLTVPYLLILDNEGEPVFYQRMANVPGVMDFKQQKDGTLTYYDRRLQMHVALNSQYEIVRTYSAGNGYTADLHDLLVLDNGHVIILIYDNQIVDMSQLVEGGQPDALVTSCVIQELDELGNVLFEWHSLDHLAILDSTRDFTAKNINYMNCNSIEVDSDGNLLLSSRNLDEITKINRQTGEVIWRMGGKKNEFTFTNGGVFSRQHDARRLPNGHMTYYDNGVFNNPSYSRGLEVAVDEVNKTVTVVREFRSVPDVSAGAMGNMQRLPGGNTVIGWGRSSQPVYSEFDSQGRLALQFDTIQGIGSYRVFRFPWQGFPNWPPQVVAQAIGNQVELFFSWNGSTETSGYMVFASDKENEEWHVATVAKDGFETSYQFEVPHYGLWEFWVVALNKDFGRVKHSERARLIVGGRSLYLPVVGA